MLHFMSENKRILNLHEKKFAELEIFQANTTVFQTNTNATMRNLETQVGQLVLSLKSQSRNAFPSSTEINPKDLTPTTLRGNEELQGSKKVYDKACLETGLMKNSSHKRSKQIELLELKTLCSLCLAKDIKLSSFLGGNPSRNFYF